MLLHKENSKARTDVFWGLSEVKSGLTQKPSTCGLPGHRTGTQAAQNQSGRGSRWHEMTADPCRSRVHGAQGQQGGGPRWAGVGAAGGAPAPHTAPLPSTRCMLRGCCEEQAAPSFLDGAGRDQVDGEDGAQQDATRTPGMLAVEVSMRLLLPKGCVTCPSTRRKTRCFCLTRSRGSARGCWALRVPWAAWDPPGPPAGSKRGGILCQPPLLRGTTLPC